MRTFKTIFGRMILLLFIWWALTEGDLSAFGVGLVISLLVGIVSMRLFPVGTTRIRPLSLLVFMVFFICRSVIAGIDVARRLLSPSLPANPGYLTVYLSLPEGGPRWLLANALSLMPGTLSVSLDGNRMKLHCLDTREPVEASVKRVERRVARVFGLPLNHNAQATGGGE